MLLTNLASRVLLENGSGVVIVDDHTLCRMPLSCYPQLHVFKSLERQAELDFMGRMLGAWGVRNGSRMERLEHRGDWDVMRPIYDGDPPMLQPYD